MATMWDDERIKNAGALLACIKDHRFSSSFAICAVSADETLAADELARKATEAIAEHKARENAGQDQQSQCRNIMTLAKKLPNPRAWQKKTCVAFDSFRDKKLADAMRLVGCEERDCKGGSAVYKKVQRFIKKPAEVVEVAEAARDGGNTTPFVIDASSPTSSIRTSVSSVTMGSSFPPTEDTRLRLPDGSTQFFSATGESASIGTSSKKQASKPGGSVQSDFEKLTTLPETRRTSDEKQRARQVELLWEDLRDTAFKMGSVLWSCAKDGKCKLTKFENADDVAETIKDVLECDIISGREIKRAVNENRIGQGAPKRGAPSRIIDEHFKDLCQLAFTAQTIEQANCDPNRLNRQELKSNLGQIVNAKLRAEGKDELDDTTFYERVQKALSCEASLGQVDKRELLRAIWLTYENQDLHFQAWERVLVEYGFGRWATNDEERAEHRGNVVFFDGQEGRIVQFDEMSFSADGSKNGEGGRPGHAPSNPNIPDAGTPENKSSARTTWMCGTTFDDQVLPPMLVLPSSADFPRIKADLIRQMHQVQGTFGCGTERIFFPSIISSSDNASVDKSTFSHWVEEMIVFLCPDAEDVPGKRVLLKADSGPGRFSDEFRCVARKHGIYFFPGLPNGTEVGQEMDQLFGLLKTIMERNRSLLFKKRFEHEGRKASTSLWDMAVIMFGGKVHLCDGTELELRNAFAESLSPAKIQGAREKCGYVPCTRAALKSEKLRHQLFENALGEVDTQADPLAALLDEMEKQNHEIVKRLTEEGFQHAKKLQRKVNRVTEVQQQARAVATRPGSRARQNMMMGISTAGEWFKGTKGECANCDDGIIAVERTRLDSIAKEMRAVKKAFLNRTKQIEEGRAMLRRKGPDPENWTVAEIKKMTQWKNPAQAVSGLNQTPLLGLWRLNKNHDPPPFKMWTLKDELNLKKAESGNVDCINRTSVTRQATERTTKFFSKKLGNLPAKEMFKVVAQALDKRTADEQEDFFQNWKDYAAINFEDDDSVSTLDASVLNRDEEECSISIESNELSSNSNGGESVDGESGSEEERGGESEGTSTESSDDTSEDENDSESSDDDERPPPRQQIRSTREQRARRWASRN